MVFVRLIWQLRGGCECRTYAVITIRVIYLCRLRLRVICGWVFFVMITRFEWQLTKFQQRYNDKTITGWNIHLYRLGIRVLGLVSSIAIFAVDGNR